MTFDMRRGRRPKADETARAIPTGRRDPQQATQQVPSGRDGARPSSAGRQRSGTRSGSGVAAAPSAGAAGGEPRTRVMPVAGAGEGARGAGPDGRGERPGGRAPGERGPGERGPGGRRPGDEAGRGGPPRGPRDERDGGRPRRGRRGRRILTVLAALVLVWALATVWAVNSAWDQVSTVDATPDGDRPDSAGRNTLLVGSDSRADLTQEQRNRLGTGQDTGGARTDSIIVLHQGGGDPTLLSIPRDSYVEIPGHGMNKINAAYAIGGPELLAETIELNTGLRMDGYMEIGFDGFANVVDAVDGVWICVQQDMDDEQAHINLKKGCQTLNGTDALGYVRARYSDPEGDLGRAQRQRQFLGALMGEVVTPANLLQPWKIHGLGGDAASNLTVGEDDSMIGTARAFWAMRAVANGEGNSVTVPVDDNNYATEVGSAVHWDEQRSQQLFDQLANNEELTVTPSDDS